MENNQKKVFVTYAHDTEEFANEVLSFTNNLRENGIDANLDQYEDSPPEGWPRWMERQIRESDFVLVLCTSVYERKINETISPKGKGVNWEIGIIYQHLYDNIANNTKFIPIIFPGSTTEDVPTPLKGATFYFPQDDASYNRLLNRLHGIKTIEKPPLGKPKSLPQKPRKNIFVTTIIDIELWNSAVWRGTLFLSQREQQDSPVPILGVLCENKVEIQAIFHGWINSMNKSDFFRDMKLSFIEGKIPNEDDEGYYVFFTSDLDEFMKRVSPQHVEGDLITTISRYNRMNPTLGSNNLEIFKDLYRKAGFCYLVPAFKLDKNKALDSSNIGFDMDYEIRFNNVSFRQISDIDSDEVEFAILKKE